MKKLTVLTYGNEILRKQSEEIKEIDSELLEIIEKMYYTMEKENGIGLAAPQIGINKKLFIMKFKDEQKITDKIIINPKLINYYGEEIYYEEGCLSIPGISEEVKRKAGVYIKSIDINGEEQNIRADGLFGRVIQHEYDHLTGRLFTDLLEDDQIKKVKKKLKKLTDKNRGKK